MAGIPSPDPPTGTLGIESALPVSDRVQIHSILITESHAKRGEDGAFEEVGLHHNIAEVEFVKDEELGMLGVQISFTLTSTKDGEVQENPALFVMAAFTVNYKVSSFDGLTEDHLRAFAGTNAVFNAWPYWREFSQSMTVRMGLPAALAPVFRIRDVVLRPPNAIPDETPTPERSSGESIASGG